jgi:transposase
LHFVAKARQNRHMRNLVAFAACLAATPAFADGGHHHPVPTPKVITHTVYVEDSSHERELAAAVIGAGITWLILRQRHKRHTQPIVVVPPKSDCSTPAPTEQRVLDACVAK